MDEKEKPQAPTQQTPHDVGMIHSVWETAWHITWHKYIRWTVLVIVVALPLVFLHPLFPIVAVLIYFSVIYSLAHGWFMQQLAAKHNFSYEKTLKTDTVSGRLFSVGHSRGIAHAVIGSYKEHPMKLFNYHYTVGSGKHSRTYHFTVSEITFERTQFPHILLQSKTMARYGSTDNFGKDKDVQISLEEPYADSFKLFCTQDYEIEALEIFTQDFLYFLETTAANFSIEFAENKIYVYDDRYITTKKELDEMFSVIHKIFDQRGALLNRLHDDFKAMHEAYR